MYYQTRLRIILISIVKQKFFEEAKKKEKIAKIKIKLI